MKAADEIKPICYEKIDACADQLKELARLIHKYPELGWMEKKACAWLADALATHGFATEKAFCDVPTAFVARKETAPGPTIALLAEYDALKGVGHGCGHNLIGPAAVGAAIGVASVIEKTAGGRVLVIGTPAEEFGTAETGKVLLQKRGAFDSVDVAILMHPMYANAPIVESLAATRCNITFRGHAAHAALDPWNGVNALDAIRITFAGVDAARQQMHPEIRIHGIITKGGDAANIIPDKASAVFMVRAPKHKLMEKTCERLRQCARGASTATGARLSFRRVATVLCTRPNATLQKLVNENFDFLGVPVESPTKLLGSSDFGNITHQLPAVWFMVRTHPEGIPWHSREVHQASVQEMALSGMIVAAKVMAGITVDLLCEPNLIAQARNDFEQAEDS